VAASWMPSPIELKTNTMTGANILSFCVRVKNANSQASPIKVDPSPLL